MNSLSLIGRHLKDDDVVEVLEDFDMTVEYDFDRSHENMPDKYWASSKANGLLFGFDEAQTLKTIFIYLAAIEGYMPYKDEDLGISFFDSPNEVEHWARATGISVERRAPKEFQGIWRESVRTGHDGKWVHYEFRHEGPSMITIFEQNEDGA